MAGESESVRAETEHEKPRSDACPKCGSIDVRPSRNASIYGRIASMLGRQPFRCRSCRVKFYRKPA